MASDILEGKWKQIRGSIKQKWGQLTEDDLAQINGKRDVLIGKLQERYGYEKGQAEAEIDKFMAENERNKVPEI